MNRECPDKNQLRDYAMGTLRSELVADLESHVAHCESCADCLDRAESDSEPLIRLLCESAATESDHAVMEAEFLTAVDSIRQRQFKEAPSTPIGDDSTQTVVGNSAVDVARPGKQRGKVPADEATPQDSSLGQYDLLQQIGRGGMGVVYKARHRKLNRIVALKVLPQSLTSDEEILERFENEMRAIGSLDHPNIVRAQDANEVDGTHLLVMEYVDGANLSAVIKRRGPLPVAEACDWIRQAAMGLQHIHEAGMVHRDIKPGNLMLSQDGTVRILDLGLALLSEAQLKLPSGTITATGQVMGTLDYMAPEQADDTHRVDIRADIYSLGATFYTLLAGRAPYAGRGKGSVLKKLKVLATEDPTPITDIRKDVPAAVVAIVDRMMAKEPTQRFTMPCDVAAALATTYDSSEATLSLKKNSPLGFQHRAGILPIALAVLCAAVFLFATYRGNKPKSLTTDFDHETRLPPSPGRVETTDLVIETPRDIAEYEIDPDRPFSSQLLAGLRPTANTTVRTALIHEFSKVDFPVERLLNQLQIEPDAGIQSALWQALSRYPVARLPADSRLSFSSMLLSQYVKNPDAEVHSSIAFLIDRWSQKSPDDSFAAQLASDLATAKKQLQTRPVPVDGGWFETLYDETMIVIPAGTTCVAGSPHNQPGRVPDDSPHSEVQHTVTLPVRIAVSSTEVTQAQYVGVLRGIVPGPSEVRELLPVSRLAWHQAAWYCNRRSELEGYPSDQFCYKRISTEPAPFGRFDVTENYRRLRGYRLLDEDEWELCCRAGSATSRFFGTDDAFASEYIAMAEAGQTGAIECASKKPNAFGFFDMLGNVAEWVNNPTDATKRRGRRARGGSTTTGFPRTRSAIRLAIDEDYPHPTVGLRLCRSLSPVHQADQIADISVQVAMDDADWRPVGTDEIVCLGTGNRDQVPVARFRVHNNSAQTVRLQQHQPSGAVVVHNKPKTSLAPGEFSEWIVSGSDTLLGARAGVVQIPVVTGTVTDSLKIRITAATHDAKLHVFEGGMSGDPTSTRKFGFGVVRQGSRVTHRFSILNAGDRDLRIVDIEAPDNFRLRSDWTDVVKGREFTWFTVTVDTETLGEYSGQIIVRTNDRVQPELSFPVSVSVVKELPASIPGVFREGMWLFDENRDGNEHPVYRHGQKGDVPLTGDWNGDGICDLCVCRPGTGDQSGVWTWHVKLLGEGAPPSIENALSFGAINGTPMLIADGHGQRCLPVVVTADEQRRLVWQFDENRDGAAEPDRTVFFGSTPNTPVAADLDGDGVAKIGFVRKSSSLVYNSEWHFLDPAASDDIVFEFGVKVDQPVVGDWNGDGKEESGAFRSYPGHPVEWFLNINRDALSEQEHAFGIMGDVPVVLSVSHQSHD